MANKQSSTSFVGSINDSSPVKESKLISQDSLSFGKLAQEQYQEKRNKEELDNMYQNCDMATKTAAVQEEFQRLMQEMTDRREGKGP